MTRDDHETGRVRVPYLLDKYLSRICVHIRTGIHYVGTHIFFLISTDIHGYPRVFTKENFNI